MWLVVCCCPQVSWVEGKKVPLIVQKSDGGFGYASTDLAAIRHRVEVEKADWVIYVTDVGQSEHFEMVFSTARQAGWLPKDAKASPKVSHVGFGLVLGEDGKRFRTRSGDLVRLVELLDEAKARCAATIRERDAEKPEEERFSEEEIESAASAMGCDTATLPVPFTHTALTPRLWSARDVNAAALLCAQVRRLQVLRSEERAPDQLQVLLRPDAEPAGQHRGVPALRAGANLLHPAQVRQGHQRASPRYSRSRNLLCPAVFLTCFVSCSGAD